MSRLLAAALLLCALPALAEPPPGPTTLGAEESHGVAGSFGDPLRAALILPGAGHVLSGLGYPVIRGQLPAAVRYEYDGVELPMPFHLLALHSVLHPALIGEVGLVHASTDAAVARRLSSAVRLQPAVEGSKPQLRAGLDLLNLSAYAQAPAEGARPELALAGRFAWTPFLGTSLLNLGSSSTSTKFVGLMGDWQLRAKQQLLGGEVRLLILGAADRAGYTTAAKPAFGGASYHRADLRVRRALWKGELELGLTGGLDGAGGEGGGQISQVRVRVEEQLARLRAAYRLLAIPGLALELGGDLEYRRARLHQSYLLRPGDVSDPSRPTLETGVTQTLGQAVVGGVYARGELRAGGLRIVPGARADVYRPFGARSLVTVEPRLDAQLKVGESLVLRAGGGSTHQPATYLVELPGVETTTMRYGLQALVEAQAGADLALTDTTSISVTGFAHPYLRTIELSLFDADFLALDPSARLGERRSVGYGGGLELSFQRRWADGWFGRAAYSLNLGVRRALVARRDLTGAVIRFEEAEFAPSYEQSHIFNGALGRELGNGYRLSGALHFNTGAPEGGGLYSFTQQPGRDVAGDARWVPVDRDEVERLPPFYRADIRLDKRFKLGTRAELIAHAEIQNFTLSGEVFRWSYATPKEKSPTARLDRSPFGVPPVVVPSVGLELRYE